MMGRVTRPGVNSIWGDGEKSDHRVAGELLEQSTISQSSTTTHEREREAVESVKEGSS